MVDYREIRENIRHGTTTVGIVCDDGIVMGADVRATYGTFVASSEAVKIHKIDDNLAMTIAGGVGDAEYLVKMIKMQNEMYKMDESRPMTPTSATSLLSIILQENKMMPFLVELLLGGLNNKGLPEIYSIDPAGGYIKESRFTSSGSGSITAVGYLESVYSKEMSTQEAAKHVAKALKIAMTRDTATGDGIRIVTVSKKGYKEYGKDEIEKMLK